MSILHIISTSVSIILLVGSMWFIAWTIRHHWREILRALGKSAVKGIKSEIKRSWNAK